MCTKYYSSAVIGVPYTLRVAASTDGRSAPYDSVMIKTSFIVAVINHVYFSLRKLFYTPISSDGEEKKEEKEVETIRRVILSAAAYASARQVCGWCGMLVGVSDST